MKSSLLPFPAFTKYTTSAIFVHLIFYIILTKTMRFSRFFCIKLTMIYGFVTSLDPGIVPGCRVMMQAGENSTSADRIEKDVMQKATRRKGNKE